MYDVTKGIVDQLISIYIYMNIDFLNRKKKPEINSKYIYAVTNISQDFVMYWKILILTLAIILCKK